VTCESCHGPGSVHVGLMSLRRETDDPRIRRGSPADCAGCHDSYNSPGSSWSEYWKPLPTYDGGCIARNRASVLVGAGSAGLVLAALKPDSAAG
jgi:hypothetical protein